jgi:outer membrane PBP1 activator LpoA protein
MKSFIFSIFVYVLIFVTGCSTHPVEKEAVQTSAPSENILHPEDLISKALESDSESLQTHYFFLAALEYWKNNLNAQSDAALGSVNPEHLTQDEIHQYLWMTLTLATGNENKVRIEKAMQIIPPQGYPHLSVDRQVEFALLLAKAHEILDQKIEAAITLIESRGLIDTEQHAEIDEKIWNLLRSTPTTLLTQYVYSGDNHQALAWLDLVRAIQLNQINLDSQYQALQMWNTLWPEHPASLNPPRELKVLQQLPNTRPDTITLALPLSGPLQAAGKAIRDGFMAKYYAQQKTDANSQAISINFFDTAKEDILSLYNEPTTNSNSLIIGPLDKTSLKAISTLEHINTPTLALNYLPSEDQLSTNLFQLGLAPETEASQIAQHLYNKNYKRIGLIVPENNLGFRILDTFKENFTSLDGEIVENVFYKDQTTLSSSVSSLLGTADSKSRKRRIQNITKTSMEFLPRRRQDIDALVMVAKPEIARQIKPLFAFHYASDLPVFASSQVHNPSKQGNNQDLEGIEFIEMPWMLSNTIDIKSEIFRAIPEANKQYTRFYALGADSFSLSPRLKLLQEVQDSQMQGHTGTLSMNENGVINRQMEWAKFRKGRALIIKE